MYRKSRKFTIVLITCARYRLGFRYTLNRKIQVSSWQITAIEEEYSRYDGIPFGIYLKSASTVFQITGSIEHIPEMIHIIKPIIIWIVTYANIEQKRLPDPVSMGII